MPEEFFPNVDKFERSQYEGTPLLETIEALSQATGKTLDDFEQMTMRQIHDLAVAHYGKENLPEIWSIWDDWNRPGQEQYMGDL
ncbi:hypothetical protein [Lignipirellula cremea]|uniref:Uncharacterized protein n=1 Tax=Lignipirellula cremea TaxID=2528010 RepID=A0A518DZ77_9BACT|nr:hypothetical protein [Lignipirellula cremea]QDU97148.1 hypothetical protein Pla8534_49930 [Lignipirellula cremea]